MTAASERGNPDRPAESPNGNSAAGSGSLAELATAINARHDLARRSAEETRDHAIACGELLVRAKAEVPHGGWEAWCRANLRFGPRQANNYTRLAEHADLIRSANRHSTSVLQYLHEIPDAVPPGLVVVHNLKAVGPRQRSGTHGFRFWLSWPDVGHHVPCDCGWAPHLATHRRARL